MITLPEYAHTPVGHRINLDGRAYRHVGGGTFELVTEDFVKRFDVLSEEPLHRTPW